MTLFLDRRDAGRQLARAVLAHVTRRPGQRPDLVLALPRGGVPVGAEVAAALEVPLDVVVVRKLGAPGQEELALGAIAAVASAVDDSTHGAAAGAGKRERDRAGGVTTVLNRELIAALGVSAEALSRVEEAETRELGRRERAYRAGRGPLEVAGLRVVVVDDGVATGATMLAAAQALRQAAAASVTLAVPVAPVETLAQLEEAADEVVCLHPLERLQSVGQWYRDFSQTSDEEVKALLAAHVARHS